MAVSPGSGLLRDVANGRDVNVESLTALKDRLVVSCQAYPGEPMQAPLIMAAVAESVVNGGAGGIRAQGLADIREVRRSVTVPLIGLIKSGLREVFITPTIEDCIAVSKAGADIVAFDGTSRPRPDGSSLSDCATVVHGLGKLVLADCGSMQDAEASIDAGADCLATTLAGYTGDRPRTHGPDLKLLQELVSISPIPVIAEGRVRTPTEALRCLELGAHAVVVGTAITHPTSIAQIFTRKMAIVQRGDT